MVIRQSQMNNNHSREYCLKCTPAAVFLISPVIG